MREHMGLFRGKRIDNGEWVEGYLFGVWEKAYILWGTTNGVPNMLEVDPNTVGECTGMRDKNGKLIFEGDILQREGCGKSSVVHTAKYHEIYGVWYVGSRLRGQESMSLLALTRVLYEIIGNIHDNPELKGLSREHKRHSKREPGNRSVGEEGI